MSLVLIYGTMFSGKSTHILNELKKNKGENILVIKHYLDNRYKADCLVTHDGEMVNAIQLNNLKDLFDIDEYKSSDTIFIDEGQFFNDIFNFVKTSINFDNKKIVVAGLVSDFEMQPFKNMVELFSMADKIIEKTCLCECGKTARFNKRLCTSTKKFLVGSNNYKPVCRTCFYK